MYSTNDPRSALAAATAPRPESGQAIATAQYFDFRDLSSPTGVSADERTAVVRGQNVILIHTFARPGDGLDNGTLDGELAVVVTAGSPPFDVITADGVTKVEAPGLVVVPPGSSRISVRGDGPLVRLAESAEAAWKRRAVNAGAYEQDHPRVTRLQRWPAPPGGDRVRVYPLAGVPDDPARFGRIFRTRSFMVNFLPGQEGPRDRKKLSPHTHDDFEQLSLAVRGEYTHHIRTPWLADATAWRDDEHVTLGSPSLAIIPPPAVHTTEARGSGTNVLVDIFSPPRADFSAQAGWVLNADDYPMP
jgi:mannose-6-phosphate isomerase-like protein (cupin superfamily)